MGWSRASDSLFATSSVRPSSGDHVKMWTAERAVSLAQVPACIVPFMYTTPLTDAIFCTLAVLHSHWGVEAIVVDYIRPASSVAAPSFLTSAWDWFGFYLL